MLLLVLRLGELLVPRTDAGVLAQLVVVVTATAAGMWRFRGDADVRRLILGIGLLLLAAMALRTAH